MNPGTKFYRAIWLCLVFPFVFSVAHAQSATIKGRLRAEDRSVPRQPSVILIDEQQTIRKSEDIDASTGDFEIKDVQEGKYIIVGCAGTTYVPSKLEIQVKEATTRQVNLTLIIPTQRGLLRGKIKERNIDVAALAYQCEVARSKTDDRGNFRLEDLPVPPRRYGIGIQTSSGKVIESNEVPVSTNRETEVELSLQGDSLVAAVARSRCDPQQTEDVDLSGTYTGKVNYREAGLTGAASVTITGNDFKLTSESGTQSGRITAVSTCGYTAAAVVFEDSNAPQSKSTLSLRVKKAGDTLNLETVAGEKQSFSFESTRATARPRRHLIVR